jgi:peptidoglycan-N-acetylglucosamine deacetylase
MPPRRAAALVLVLAAVCLAAFSLAACSSPVGVLARRSPSLSAAHPGIGGGFGVPTSAPPTSPSTGTTATPSPTHRPPAPTPSPPSGTAHGQGPYGTMAVTGSSSVALTFDDGPGPYTAQILSLLEQNHVHATFCLIGRQVSAYAADIRRMVADGDTLCNHTWDHDEHLGDKPASQIKSELTMTDDAIHQAAPGALVRYFRNPGGNYTPQTIEIAKDLGMTSLYWSVDPSDWKEPGTQAIINSVIAHTRRGSIVLSHDGGGNRSQTVAAYKVLLPYLKQHFTLIALPVS